jgi:hypothetical protein
MGYLLSKSVPSERIVALDVAHSGGTAWVCLGSDVADCGPQKLRERGPGGEGITLNESPEKTGHHGWYHVGSISASPPARDSLDDAEEETESAKTAALPDAEVLWQLETGG